MTDTITLKIADIIGSPLCISAEDGQKVFEKIKYLLRAGKEVNISFHRVSILVALFLNIAIGQLYGSFSEEEIRSRMQVEGLSMDDLVLLKRVVENAKRYYANPKCNGLACTTEVEEGD